jgi:hypothetical protein
LPVIIAIPALSVSAHAVPGPATLFAVWEVSVGDLNGDGDTFDAVWHVYDAKAGTTTTLGMAAASVCSDSFLPPPLLLCIPTTTSVVDKKISAVLVGEKEQGATDLNGDGDSSDTVAAVYDGRTGAFTVAPLATAHVIFTRFGIVSTWVPVPPLIVGDTLALLVDERDHGGIDLNGDTDVTDQVLHLFEVDTGQLLNVGLADATVQGPFGSPLGSRNPLALETTGQKVMMLVGEAEQGGIDLNQDGDADDQVAVVINAQNGRVKVAARVHSGARDLRTRSGSHRSSSRRNGGASSGRSRLAASESKAPASE